MPTVEHSDPGDRGAENQQLYRTRFDGRAAYRDLVWGELTRSFFSRWIRPSDTVLDLGAGHCEFSNNVVAARRIALDLNPDVVSLASAGVHPVVHDCATPWPVEAGSLDVVFTSNFLEHLPTKQAVSAALGHARTALRAGGLLIAMGPNVRYVPGQYWDFFDHHVALTDRSLGEALTLAGFEIDTSVDRFLPYSMSDGRRYPMLFLRTYLRSRPAWKLLGRQFLVVARNPVASLDPRTQAMS